MTWVDRNRVLGAIENAAVSLGGYDIANRHLFAVHNMDRVKRQIRQAVQELPSVEPTAFRRGLLFGVIAATGVNLVVLWLIVHLFPR